MAIGDVQNRFNIGGQEFNRTDIVNADRSRIRPGGGGENRQNAVNAGLNERVRNQTAQQTGNSGNQALRVNISRNRINEERQENRTPNVLQRSREPVQTRQPERPRATEGTRNNLFIGREEDVLYGNDGGNRINSAGNRNGNRANAAVERSQQAQIDRIQNNRTNRANDTRNVQTQQSTLTPENLLGSRLDVTG